MIQTLKRVSKRSLSIILTLMMIVSTMMAGLIAADAADQSSSSGQVIYFKPSTTWNNNNSPRYAVYAFNSDSDKKWYSMNVVNSGDRSVFYAVMDGSYSGVIFCAMNPANTTNDWNNKWNQTKDLKFQSDKNCYTYDNGNWDNGSGSWGNYQPTSNVSLTATPSTDIKVGDSVALSTKLTSYTTYNAKKSSAYTSVTLNGVTATSGTDYTITNDTFVPKKAGQFVITASVVYNAKGFTNITKTAKPSVTIDVAASEVTGITVQAKKTDNGTSYVDGGGTVTIGAPTVDSDGTQVTATADDGYVFTGWESSGAGTFESSTSATTTYYPAENNEVATAKFSKVSAVTYSNPQNATITVTNSSGTDISKTPVGDTVTVKVTPSSSNYTCSGITVTPSVNDVNGSNGTYTFKMPGNDVNITVNITEKQQYNVTVSTNDDSMGTASASANTVLEGDTVTLTATAADGYIFTDWTVLSGTYELTSGSSLTNSSITLTPTSNLSIKANFEEFSGTVKTGFYAFYATNNKEFTDLGSNDAGVSVYELESGVYKATLTPSNVGGQFGSDIFVSIANADNVTSSFYYYDGAKGFTVTTDTPSLVTLNVNNKDGVPGIQDYDNNKWYPCASLTGAVLIDKVTIQVDTNTKTYTINAYKSVQGDVVSVYAKDGSTHDGGTNRYGETTITSGTIEGTTTLDKGTYRIYYAVSGSVITIQTKVNTSYNTAGFYVFAYVINGETAYVNSMSGGVYQASYVVPEGVTALEITPVYYNSKIDEAGDYITFYANASEVKDIWGNMVGCYAYYYHNGTNDSAGRSYADGSYPGQPMVKVLGGKYMTKIPRYYYDDSGTKYSYFISGITLNNFAENDLHNSFVTDETQKKNQQTYDYDDLKILADPALNYDTIQFDMKYRNKYVNKGFANTGSITISSVASRNGWDRFVDYDDKNIDILGNEVTSSLEPIYIVSTGNNSSSIGTWSTMWYVYNENGDYITSGHPSDFIKRASDSDNTSAYNTMNVSQYLNRPTYISFEAHMGNSNVIGEKDNVNSGIRVDGRWYYKNSKLSQVTVDTQVQFSDDEGQTWNFDTTGTKGSATVDGQTEITYNSANVSAEINAIAGNGYIFVEWGIVDDNNENYRTISTSIHDTLYVDTNYHLVARFEKVDDETLVLSHKKYAGPGAFGGKGFYFISAVLHKKNGETVTFAETQGDIPVAVNYLYDDKIVITLRTVCTGMNTFIDYYELVNGTYQIIGPDDIDNYGSNTPQAYTFEVSVEDLCDTHGNLNIQSLKFFSDIAPVTKNAKLIYEYLNRFGDIREYVKNVTLSEEYIAEYGFTVTDKLIYDNAPAIDDLYKDCTWTISDSTVNKEGVTARLKATHLNKKFYVTINDGVHPELFTEAFLDDFINYDAEAEKINGTKDSKPNFYMAPSKNDEDASFSHWLVTENGNEVAKCYSRYFNLRIAGDYNIIAVYDAKSESLTISDANYTREQFTDSTGSTSTDYLYADFIVSYMNSSSDQGVLLNSVLGKDYKTGLVIEFDMNIKVNVPDEVGNTLDDSQKIKFDDEDNLAPETIEEFVRTGKSSYVFDSDNDSVKNRALYNFEIDNANYNNKNRLDFYVRFKNTANYRQYVMKAYYYVIDPAGNYSITAPVYFYLYDIGNSDTVTS